MARKAVRPLNVCNDCEYSWHPRGKDVARKCPDCGSRNVGLPPTPESNDIELPDWVGYLIALGLIALIFIYLDAHGVSLSDIRDANF